MVSDDSTSRVMVLPVTESKLAMTFFIRRGGESQELTSLDEDLHDCGVFVSVMWVV